MPRINDQVLRSIVYLYESEDQAKTGHVTGATGFLLAVPYEYREQTVAHLYVVTNAHVIEQMDNNIRDKKGRSIAIRINRSNGQPYIYPSQINNWEFHPDDDLAVCYLYVNRQIKEELNWLWIPRSWLITEDIVRECNIGVGTDVYIVGRFSQKPGRLSNKPTVRIGHIALMNDKKEKIPQGKNRPRLHEQESFVLNCRSDGGFSGSPVFVDLASSVDGLKLLATFFSESLLVVKRDMMDYATGISHIEHPEILSHWFDSQAKIAQEQSEKIKALSNQLTLRLLGINWGHYPAIGTTETGEEYGDNTNFSCTVPAWQLNDLLDKPRLVSDRELMEEKFRKEVDSYFDSQNAVLDEREHNETQDE